MHYTCSHPCCPFCGSKILISTHPHACSQFFKFTPGPCCKQKSWRGKNTFHNLTSGKQEEELMQRTGNLVGKWQRVGGSQSVCRQAGISRGEQRGRDATALTGKPGEQVCEQVVVRVGKQTSGQVKSDGVLGEMEMWMGRADIITHQPVIQDVMIFIEPPHIYICNCV